MNDHVKSLRVALFEKSNDSFFGKFILAFLVKNWKIPVILTANGIDGKDRIAMLSSYIGESGWSKLLLCPFFATAVLILILPLFSYCALYVSEFSQVKYREVKQKFEGLKLISVDESNKIRLFYAKREKELNEILGERERQIKDLQDRIKFYPASKLLPRSEHRLLLLLYQYQKDYNLTKLVIGRDGELRDDQASAKNLHCNVILNLYEISSVSQSDKENFEKDILGLVGTYISLIPETRLGSPYVIQLRQEASDYLRTFYLI